MFRRAVPSSTEIVLPASHHEEIQRILDEIFDKVDTNKVNYFILYFYVDLFVFVTCNE